MKPTPEQIAAAKARARGAETEDQWVVLNKAGGGEVSDNACAILLAALEAAEVDGARLDWLEANKETSYNPPALSRVMLGWPLELSLREALDDARKEDRI